ncbi:MAG: stage II sporulation protein R [Oscillibacter sp.]|nr:stage II sporulation protein R [Oscillibacter sp.]
MENTIKKQNNRKIFALLLAVVLLAGGIWGAWSLRSQRELSDKVVRLHILANSDSDEDQALKLKVRDVILQRAERILKESENREAAEDALRAQLPALQSLAEEKIRAEGYDYSVTAELRDTEFPTREYDTFTLPAGKYLALRIVIGSGEGHNWWCVVFPPLCAETTTDFAQTAMAAGLSEDDIKLVTEENSGYVLKFKSIELWEQLKEKWTNG